MKGILLLIISQGRKLCTGIKIDSFCFLWVVDIVIEVRHNIGFMSLYWCKICQRFRETQKWKTPRKKSSCKVHQKWRWVLISINITDLRDNIHTEICQYVDRKVNTLQLPWQKRWRHCVIPVNSNTHLHRRQVHFVGD